MCDNFLACPYCGDTMKALNEKQLEIFGVPVCCDREMITLDKNKTYDMIRNGLDKLKESLEQDLIEGI